MDTIHQWGTKPLIVYGGGSIKRNGAYDAVVSRLKEANIPYAEMGGVAPNPRYESVLEGNRICREEQCDILLPIGGASAIDCAKSIAATVNYDGSARHCRPDIGCGRLRNVHKLCDFPYGHQ